MSLDLIRNIAFVGHGGSGKTTLAESLLLDSGAITRPGRIEEGTTVMDFEPEETKRHMSVNAAVAPYKVGKVKVNLVDTPGYADFVGEVISALHVVDGAIVVLGAISGVEVQAEILWKHADARALPRFIFVNKMDRENADFNKAYGMAIEAFGTRCVAAELPIGSADTFDGVIDLAAMKAFRYRNGKPQETEIPDDLLETAKTARERLLDAAVETDETLMEKYLSGNDLTADEIRQGIRFGVTSGALVPVFCGSAVKMIGLDRLNEALVSYLPSPEQLPAPSTVDAQGNKIGIDPAADSDPIAYVFKTMADPYIGKLSLFRVYSGTVRSDSPLYNANQEKAERLGQVFSIFGKKHDPAASIEPGDIGAVAKLAFTHTGETLCSKEAPVMMSSPRFPEPVYSQAIYSKVKGDDEKLSSSLTKLAEEDPTFSITRDAELRQTLISGLGEMHLDIMLDRLQRKFAVEGQLKEPKVAFRETIRKKIKVQGRYKKQTGGRGQFGDCWIEIEPLPRGSGFEFVDKIFGGSIPQQFRPAVEKGIRETMEEGIIAGYPVVDIRVTLVDGSHHPVDSSEMAFKIAGSMALKKGFDEAGGVLLGPVMKVEVDVPDSMIGDVIGDLNSRHGKVAGMELVADHTEHVEGLVSASEMHRYAIDLRSITGGRGNYRMTFDHYEEVPAHLAEKIAAARNGEQSK